MSHVPIGPLDSNTRSRTSAAGASGYYMAPNAQITICAIGGGPWGPALRPPWSHCRHQRVKCPRNLQSPDPPTSTLYQSTSAHPSPVIIPSTRQPPSLREQQHEPLLHEQVRIFPLRLHVLAPPAPLVPRALHPRKVSRPDPLQHPRLDLPHVHLPALRPSLGEPPTELHPLRMALPPLPNLQPPQLRRPLRDDPPEPAPPVQLLQERERVRVPLHGRHQARPLQLDRHAAQDPALRRDPVQQQRELRLPEVLSVPPQGPVRPVSSDPLVEDDRPEAVQVASRDGKRARDCALGGGAGFGVGLGVTRILRVRLVAVDDAVFVRIVRVAVSSGYSQDEAEGVQLVEERCGLFVNSLAREEKAELGRERFALVIGFQADEGMSERDGVPEDQRANLWRGRQYRKGRRHDAEFHRRDEHNVRDVLGKQRTGRAYMLTLAIESH
ncbi:hypothetical protein C8Q76DRAFT_446766 [Earliella scabrosa]|nr:hypothetical protein C8Q76DRAFT_446766 [Earliella scabrosa]